MNQQKVHLKPTKIKPSPVATAYSRKRMDESKRANRDVLELRVEKDLDFIVSRSMN